MKSAKPSKKKALVIEGGGMRGAHTCGALIALTDRGHKDFDVVAATSAGACTAAFLVSGQHELLPNIWTQYLHDGRFIDLKRLPFKKSVMNLDYLIQEVFSGLQPLDLPMIQNSLTWFFVSATDCHTGKSFHFNNHEHSILPALKASSAMPIAYRGPVVINGRSYVDGGITDPIPIQKALDEGCDEVIVLLTRPEGYRKQPHFLNLIPRLFRKKYPRLAEALTSTHHVYNSVMDKIDQGKFSCRLKVIRPSSKLPVTRLTTHLPKIRAAIEQGYHDALKVLK